MLVAPVQETYFIWAEYFLLAYDSRSSAGVSLLVGRRLDADVNVVLEGDEGRLVVADVTVESFKFRLVVVYAPNTAVERVSFFSSVGGVLGRFEAASLNG